MLLAATDGDDESLIGDLAHIIGETEGSARSTESLNLEERNHSDNLLLLCRNHHKMVDDQEVAWTAERLRQIKTEHEAWVRGALPPPDREIQLALLRFASMVDEWSQRAALDTWREWTHALLANGQPSLSQSAFARAQDLRAWLFTRVWPEGIPELVDSLSNFRFVLSDLVELFSKHAELRGTQMWTRKFYQIDHWDDELYHALADDFDFHVDLVQDLTLELTRAANHVCSVVREQLDPQFRLEEGHLTLLFGIDLRLQQKHVRPLYQEQELAGTLYPGLRTFCAARST